MEEVEIVIKASNCFSVPGGDCPDCPCSFRNGEYSCEANVIQQAQKLLKEQERRINGLEKEITLMKNDVF